MVRPALAAVTPSDSRPTLAVVAGTSTQNLERLGAEIAELAAHLDVATYHLLVLIREFYEREGWHSGFRTCAHWLSHSEAGRRPAWTIAFCQRDGGAHHRDVYVC
jgi:hypothetical protein